jgi:trans-2,3-dihydro-3-hydroxyanthranilate isomerase
MSQPIENLAAFDPSPAGGGVRRAYLVVDVFTDAPLAGNQLAVFTDGRGLATDDMQRLARELNLAETVFLGEPAGEGDVDVRIFTPTAELPFAGHPVLGTAVVVASALGRDRVVLRTGSGPVAVRVRREDGRVVSGWMEQPLPSWRPYESAEAVLRALGLAGSRLPVELYDNGPRHVLVELDSAEAVAALHPDLHALAELGEICISCFAGAGRHWKTRMFAPGLGVAEDPATGSAAGPLAVHLSRHGRIDFGAEIEISQGSEIGRPSLLYAFAAGTAERLEGVHVGGSAVIVARGEFFVA